MNLQHIWFDEVEKIRPPFKHGSQPFVEFIKWLAGQHTGYNKETLRDWQSVPDIDYDGAPDGD